MSNIEGIAGADRKEAQVKLTKFSKNLNFFKSFFALTRKKGAPIIRGVQTKASGEAPRAPFLMCAWRCTLIIETAVQRTVRTAA